MPELLSWSDQPEHLAEMRVLGKFHVEEAVIEVRHTPSLMGEPTYYVSAGNLFGSETVECDSASTALLVVLMIGAKATRRGRRGPALTLPPGAKKVVR